MAERLDDDLGIGKQYAMTDTPRDLAADGFVRLEHWSDKRQDGTVQDVAIWAKEDLAVIETRVTTDGLMTVHLLPLTYARVEQLEFAMEDAQQRFLQGDAFEDRFGYPRRLPVGSPLIAR